MQVYFLGMFVFPFVTAPPNDSTKHINLEQEQQSM